jgi:hypothetical protein
MKKTVLVMIAGLIATLALLVAGRGLLPGGLRLQASDGTLNSPAATAAHGEHVGAAPQAIVPPPDGSRVLLTTVPAAKTELGYTISVKVTSPAGKPVNDATIRFYDIVELFGQREELIGTAVTDGQGLTAITYLPASTGTRQIVARFAGQGTLIPSLGVTTLEATVAAPPYRVDQPPLALFSRYVPYAAGVVVLIVWGLIALSLFGTARGVVASANEANRKGDTA